MARRVRDSALESKTAREKLVARGRPYYRQLGDGVHIGYRKGKTGGRWVARLYLGGQSYRVETLAAADDKLDANGSTVLNFWQAQERARDLHGRLAGDAGEVVGVYTVGEAIEDYLVWLEGHRKSAGDSRYRADALILPTLKNKDVAKLTAKEIRQWHRSLAESPARLRTKPGKEQRFKPSEVDDPDAVRRRRATANRTMTVLKAALNRAWREGKVASDAQWRRVEPFEGVETARVRYLTVAEAKRLVNACDPAFRRLVQAALQTGARYGELAALRVADFNPDSGTVTIGQSKSGKSRHIVLTDEGLSLFKGFAAGRKGTDLLLHTESGGAWGTSHQSRPMAAACINAQITPHIGFHGLRHTWASLSVMNGVPLLVVARNLGHADTRMVERHYGHLAPSFIADAIRAGAPRFGLVDSSVTGMVRAQ